MIREHEFRGAFRCTWKYHMIECGRLKHEHESVAIVRKHIWGAVVLRVREERVPVLACTRRDCRTKWFPDRNEPKSECKGL
jgi:hypothetical protein